MSNLEILYSIPHNPDAVFPRAGAYAPSLNVWVCDGFEELARSSSPERQRLLEAYAGMALAAGKLHHQQLADARHGRLWPADWIAKADGASLAAYGRLYPPSASPYACISAEGKVIPYSQAYASRLNELLAWVQPALDSGDASARLMAPYLLAMQQSFTAEPARLDDRQAMERLDLAWVQTPAEIPVLLLAEFTENYSDPLKPRVADQPAVQEYARSVVELTGLPPWKVFFELRVMAEASGAASPAEIDAIRQTARRLYTGLVDGEPSPNALTEFRRQLIVAGHGANPPKSAKNYPNQESIRSEAGYRNMLYSNQVEASLQNEILPALQVAFEAPWSQDTGLLTRLMRWRALGILGHEECHAWAPISAVSWMEELKADILGLWTVANTPGLNVEPSGLLTAHVGACLLLHRYHEHLQRRGDLQFNDYHVGNTLFLEHLMRQGFFKPGPDGLVRDMDRSKAQPALEAFANRILSVRRGQESIQTLYDDLYSQARIYTHFRGWDQKQEYFESLWQ